MAVEKKRTASGGVGGGKQAWCTRENSPFLLPAERSHDLPLDKTIFEMQAELEKLRAAYEEMKIQNEALISSASQYEIQTLRYQSLLSESSEPYLITDLNGKILKVNSATVTALNIKRDFLENKIITGLILIEDRKQFRKALNQLRLGEDPLEFNVFLKARKALTANRFHAHAAVLRTAEGEPVEIRWRLTPVYENPEIQRVGADSSLGTIQPALELEKFLTAYAALSSARTVSDLVQSLADAAAKIVGDIAYLGLLTPDKKRITPVAAASSNGDHETLLNNYRKSKAHSISGNVAENVIKTCSASIIGESGKSDNVSSKDGPKKAPLNMMLVPVRVGNSVIGVLTLIREKNKAPYSEYEMKLVQALADHAGSLSLNFTYSVEKQKASADLSFYMAAVAAMCRNLQGPLHAILGYTSYLAESGGDISTSEVLQDYDKINSAALTLNDSIGEMFELSQLELGIAEAHPERVPFSAIISDLETEIRYGMGIDSFSIATEVEVKYLHVLLNPNWTRQMVVKLLRVVNRYCDDYAVECSYDEQDVWLVIACTGALQSEVAAMLKQPDSDSGHFILRSDNLNAEITLRLMLVQRLCKLMGLKFVVEPGGRNTFVRLGFSLIN